MDTWGATTHSIEVITIQFVHYCDKTLLYDLTLSKRNLWLTGCTLTPTMFPELFMEALGRASPLEDAEACIYGYGALKFLTMNDNLLLTSLHFGALELMVLHIKIVNNNVSTDTTYKP